MTDLIIAGQKIVILEKKDENTYIIRKARGKKHGFLLLDKMRYVIGTECVNFHISEFKKVA